jgi:peptide/nickel transport system substrate-binding protein
MVMFVSMACPRGAFAANPAKDTLVIGSYMDPVDLHPHNHNLQWSHTIKSQMYETLIIADSEGVKPNLAESWQWEDDTTLVINLKKGVKFHNGYGEMKASDILFTISLLKVSNYSTMAVEYVDMEKSFAKDDYTVVLKLTGPFAAQMNYFNWPLTAIVSEAGYKANDGDFSKQSIGTGPYKLAKWVKDSEVVMVKHDEYWEEDKPHIPNLIFRVIPEATTRTLELESGGIDVALTLSTVDVARLEARNDTYVMRGPSMQMWELFFNFKNEHLAKYNVRKAICMAIDWAPAIMASFGDSGIPASNYLAPGVEGYVKFDPISYDPEGARALLAGEGYKDGDITITFFTSNTEVRVKFCEVIQGFLQDIGINVQVKPMEQAAFVDAYLGSEHDLTHFGYTAVTMEAGKVLPYYQSSNIYNATVSWHSPEFDKLVDDARVNINEQERVSRYVKAQQMLFDNLVSYPCMQPIILAGVRSNLTGFELEGSFEVHRFKHAYFTE